MLWCLVCGDLAHAHSKGGPKVPFRTLRRDVAVARGAFILQSALARPYPRLSCAACRTSEVASLIERLPRASICAAVLVLRHGRWTVRRAPSAVTSNSASAVMIFLPQHVQPPRHAAVLAAFISIGSGREQGVMTDRYAEYLRSDAWRLKRAAFLHSSSAASSWQRRHKRTKYDNGSVPQRLG